MDTTRRHVTDPPFLAVKGSHMDSVLFDEMRTEDEPDAFAQEAMEAGLGQPVAIDPVPDELWRLVMPTNNTAGDDIHERSV